MFEAKLVNNEPTNIIWEITFEANDVKQFFEWLNKLESYRVGLQINGQLYRFATLQELACFTYGMSFMNEMITELSIKTFRDKQRSDVKLLDEEIHLKKQKIVEAVKEFQEFMAAKEKELTSLTNEIVMITYK